MRQTVNLFPIGYVRFESHNLHQHNRNAHKGYEIEISEVLRNGKGKQRPIMMKDWIYCFEGWTSLNKYIAGREAMRDASVTVPAAQSVTDWLTAPQGLGTMEACCDVSQM